MPIKPAGIERLLGFYEALPSFLTADCLTKERTKIILQNKQNPSKGKEDITVVVVVQLSSFLLFATIAALLPFKKIKVQESRHKIFIYYI